MQKRGEDEFIICAVISSSACKYVSLETVEIGAFDLLKVAWETDCIFICDSSGIQILYNFLYQERL